MSHLRLFLCALGWVTTLNFAHAADRTLWKPQISLANRINRVELARNGDEMAQRDPTLKQTQAMWAKETFREKNPESLLQSRIFSTDLNSLLETDQDNFLDEQGKGKLLALGHPKVQFVESDGSGHLRGTSGSICQPISSSGRDYKTFESVNYQPSTARVSRRDSPSQDSRQVKRGQGKLDLSPQFHVPDSPVEFVLRLFSYLRRKPQYTDSRMVSSKAPSRIHGSSRLQEAFVSLCGRNPFTCFRRRAMALNDFNSHIKRNKFRSPYLLGGAMGRR